MPVRTGPRFRSRAPRAARSEADFAEKVRNLKVGDIKADDVGFRVCQYSDIKVFHKSQPIKFEKLKTRQMGGSCERVYFLMRNRFIYIKKWGSLLEKLAFTLIFSHVYTIYYFWFLLISGEGQMFCAGLIGVLHGYIFIIFGKL